MVLSGTDTFKNNYRSGSQPILLVEIDIGPAAYLQVVGYASGAGDTVTITRTIMGSDTVVTLATLTEGVDFDAETDDETTAQNIASAINTYSEENLDLVTIGEYSLAIRAAVVGDTVVLTGEDYKLLAFASSDENAWTADPVRLPRTIKFVSGDKPFGVYQYPCSVAEVSGISASMDPVSRETSIGNIDITLKDDGVFREYMRRTYVWETRPVRVKAGFHGMNEEDFVPIASALFDDFRTDYGSITIQTIEPKKRAIGKTYVGSMINVHPIDALGEVLRFCGIEYTESEGFDRTGSEHTNTGHWGVSLWANDDGGQPADGLIDELMKILGGTLIVDPSTGSYIYRGYDPNAAAVRHFTEDEIADYESLSNSKLSAQRVTIKGRGGVILFSNEDDYSADQKNVNEFVLETDFLGGHPFGGINGENNQPLAARLGFGLPLLNGTDSTLTIYHGYLFGFAGTRIDVATNLDISAGIIEPTDELSASQTAILMIKSPLSRPYSSSDPRLGYEYIECDAHGFVDLGGSLEGYDNFPTAFTDPDNSFFGGGVGGTGGGFGQKTTVPKVSSFTVKTGGRGVQGTYATVIAVGFSEVEVYDVTVALAVANRVLSRASDGMPEVRFRVPLSHIDLQIGDIFTFDHPLFLGFKMNGADNTAIWEATSVEIDVISDSPGITVTAALVRTSNKRRLSTASPPFWPPVSVPSQSLEVMTTNDGSENYVTADGELYYI